MSHWNPGFILSPSLDYYPCPIHFHDKEYSALYSLSRNTLHETTFVSTSELYNKHNFYFSTVVEEEKEGVK